MALQRKIVDFIESNRRLGAVKDPDESLELDSLGVIRLVAFLQNDCDINVADEDITAENFETMRRLEELIASKLQAGETEERSQRLA